MPYIERVNQNTLFRSLKSPYITAILGPRRVGKSTIMHHYAARHRGERPWVFLDMDILLERDQIEQGGLQALIEERITKRIDRNQKICVSIDEAQKCPHLFDQIKILYDKFKSKNAIKFILTGSASLNLHQLSAESLAGRIQLFYLQDFSLRESALLTHPYTAIPYLSTLEALCDHQDISLGKKHIESLSPLRKILSQALDTQLLWGGMPEVLLTHDENKKNFESECIRYLSDYLHTYLEKDVRAVETITDLSMYRNLITLTAELTGFIRDDTRIKQALGCHAETLKKYRGFLEATLLYKDIPPYVGSSLKRLIKTPKGYLLNNGLISLVTGIYDLSLLEKSGLVGHRLENWFLKELQIWLSRTPHFYQIDYWRTSNGIEVDFIVSKPPHVFPFEVTYSKKVDHAKVKHLQIFLEEEPKAKMAYYIYNGDFHYDKSSRICFIPAWAVG